MALAIDVIRFGLHRDLRKMRQDFRAGDAALDRRSRSGKCPVEGLFCGSEFLQGFPLNAGGQPRASTLVGEIGQDRNALALADPDDPVGAGCGQVVSPARQGG
ncbi:hypothetical protein ADL12_11065 [Streptomyces regalis]|uniref:Uncharacterized protein n=1 Tax=Streptomyces regalis TaxID=68262 RepID=A0A0X3VAH8_9ACTN|nr:hypothetical protein ADL12_11065 [Streptomyces regalis]